MRAPFCRSRKPGGLAACRFIYERCAAVDVGKDVIAVAVRQPGDGPGGRVRRSGARSRRSTGCWEAARWLSSQGVTHVAMEATGIYSHARLPCADGARGVHEGAGVQRRAREERPGPQDGPGGRASGWRTCWSAGCWRGSFIPPGGRQGGPGRDPVPGEGRAAADSARCSGSGTCSRTPASSSTRWPPVRHHQVGTGDDRGADRRGTPRCGAGGPGQGHGCGRRSRTCRWRWRAGSGTTTP